MNILILCPLPLELDALILQMQRRGHTSQTRRIGSLKLFEFADLGWTFALGGHGKAQFGIQTQFLMSHFDKLDVLICAGGAGGLESGVSIFDVVVGEKTIEHDYQLKFIKKPLPEFLGDAYWIQKVREKNHTEFKVHIGTIASGDEDIVDAERSSELRSQTGAIAVAWEGSGGARACKFNSIPFLEIRGITDTASHTASVDYSLHLQVAMHNVCDVLLASFVG